MSIPAVPAGDGTPLKTGCASGAMRSSRLAQPAKLRLPRKPVSAKRAGKQARNSQQPTRGRVSPVRDLFSRRGPSWIVPPGDSSEFSARITAMNRRTLLQSIPALALLAQTAAAEPQATGSPSTAVFELRIYHTYEGKLETLLTRFREHTMKIFREAWNEEYRVLGSHG